MIPELLSNETVVPLMTDQTTPGKYLGILDDSGYDIEYLDQRTNKETKRYYELFIDADEMEPRPIISVEKYDTLDEVRDKPSTLACGGVAFILFRVRDGEREIVASYCSAHDVDGWIDEGRLEWETEEQEKKFFLKKLAYEAIEKHLEYIRQKREEALRQESEAEEKCNEIIARCRTNLGNMKYPPRSTDKKFTNKTRYDFDHELSLTLRSSS